MRSTSTSFATWIKFVRFRSITGDCYSCPFDHWHSSDDLSLLFMKNCVKHLTRIDFPNNKQRDVSLLTRIPNKSATSRDFVLTETFQVDFLFCWHGISIADYNLFHLLIYCSNMSLYVMRYDIYTINDSLFCLCLRTMYIRGKNVVVWKKFSHKYRFYWL